MTTPTLHFMTPTYRPAGGVVKLMDYVNHALAGGYGAAVYCAAPRRADEPLFEIERFRGLRDSDDVAFLPESQLQVGDDDLVVISLPVHYPLALAGLRPWMSPDRIVHIVQGVRHANPRWLGGGPLRTLSRPASRISINEIVAGVIAPYLDPRGLHRTINLGHEVGYFAHPGREVHDGPLRVAYTTWKSEIGDKVAHDLRDDARFELRAVREQTSWEGLRTIYRWADVFLSTPGPEEGFYLPGLEAMAAGAVVVTPDVGGNMAYCVPDVNCLLVGYEDVAGYVTALRRVEADRTGLARALREQGLLTCEAFDLGSEGELFREFVAQVRERAADREGRPSPSRPAHDRTTTGPSALTTDVPEGSR
ncbi:glycosyl transferase family 1 [Sediminihabitans luteus]|uniref:Glycosyl transferase family 1 n=1 Tax=Sediminihabitans luteus TaxID=1138585 RepID=A0A2M9CE08_9CELL|nr:glycosyltransferase [Sediminihabitans luteus]PJJ70164.1 glycosyl transferase family 1 [Sediminihabitans luteus]GII97635.1 hypothetical protein Slu03_00130 [Sediminihabitans luteus]